MGPSRRLAMGIALIVAIFLFIQLSAIALVEPFVEGGLQPVEDPKNPANSLFYVAVVLVATLGMLLAFKYDLANLLRIVIVGAGAWISVYVFQVWLPPTVTFGGYNALALACGVVLGVVLFVHPEWYVIDAAGALMGAAAAGLFGITFGILPALVLLTVLAVYDAISVYGTEHMLTLASGVMDLKVPVVLVIPMSAGYSFLEASTPEPGSSGDQGSVPEGEGENAPNPVANEDPESDERASSGSTVESDEGEQTGADEGPLDRDALFIGLGDAIIPSILVASAAFFAPADVSTVLGVPLPAVSAMIGTFLGLAVLLRMVFAGRAHAGLPLLNGGSIAGYLVGALLAGISLVDALGLGPYL